MWANAQRDGRLAEYRWCPVFNAAKFSWYPLLECRAVTKPRRETRNWNSLGVPQTNEPISVASGPKFTILWGHVGRYCCLTSFFSTVDTCLICEDIAQQTCAMVPRWRFLVTFLASCIFSEPPAARFRPASEIHTKDTPCVEVWQTSNLWPMRLGKEKKERKKK